MNPFTRFGFISCLSLLAVGASNSRAHAATIADKGDFVVAYPQPKKADYRELQVELKKEKVLEAFAEVLNSTLALPCNITLEFKELGEANAYYDPNTRRISIGYELMEYMQELFSHTSNNDDVVTDRTLNAVLFIFCHELGHALVDVYDLPVVGKEEDAVDQLSFVILSDSDDPNAPGNDNNKMVLDGAQSFLLSSRTEIGYAWLKGFKWMWSSVPTAARAS